MVCSEMLARQLMASILSTVPYLKHTTAYQLSMIERMSKYTQGNAKLACMTPCINCTVPTIPSSIEVATTLSYLRAALRTSRSYSPERGGNESESISQNTRTVRFWAVASICATVLPHHHLLGPNNSDCRVTLYQQYTVLLAHSFRLTL